MRKLYRQILRHRKQRIQRRLQPKNFSDQPKPMFQGGNLHYEMAERIGAISCGGIGAIHTLAQQLGLVQEIDQHLQLLKVHLPYHESDHVLNFAYNIMAGGVRIQDMELRRQDENFLNGLGAQRIPDPTTAGDFTRRFAVEDLLTLQECINRTRQRVWQQQPAGFLAEAFIDVDGTIAETLGECKAGLALSYKGIWGYAPLVLTLANTKEVLYLVNRPGNAQGLGFILGMDAHPKVVTLAQELKAKAWHKLERLPQYEILTEPRTQRERIKEQIVRQKGYRNIVLQSEDIAEIDYQPLKCGRKYRLVILRKNLTVESGEKVLFEDVRYFFYLTNRTDLTMAEVVGLANGRCDQENVIEQLKNGVNAMRMPVNDLESNWAYMVMTALAWNLKAWFALLVPERERGLELLKMEFRGFLQAVIQLPCQIVRTGRKLVYRILSYNGWLKDFFATFERIAAMSAALSGP